MRNNQSMKTYIRKFAIAVVLLGTIATGTVALAQQRTYTYYCPKCNVTVTYTMPAGVPKCPNDGTGMFLRR